MLASPDSISKTCSRCRKELPKSDFCIDRRRKDGLNPQCRLCRKPASRATYEKEMAENPEARRARIRKSVSDWRARHPGSAAAHSREWYENRGGREWTRRHLFKKKYGITLEQYDEMLSAQEGKCAICRKQETVQQRGKLFLLSVDHNHQTGKVRALLCSKCNRALGFFDEKPRRLLNAAIYLLTHEEPQHLEMLEAFIKFRTQLRKR